MGPIGSKELSYESASERRICSCADAPQIDKPISGLWPGEPRRQIVSVPNVAGFSNSVTRLRIIATDWYREMSVYFEHPLP